ncbi:MAG TPA: hypothetical protein ENN46_04220 [Candidatus Woesearchaeota archaeon]|nr:hypothetical protein [Candidatus Woesearchaeota archaeon]
MNFIFGFAITACSIMLLIVGKELSGRINIPKKKIIQGLTGISWLILAFSLPLAFLSDFTIDFPALLGIMLCSGITLHSALIINEKIPKDYFRRHFAFLFLFTLSVFHIFFSVFGQLANYFSFAWLVIPIAGAGLANGMRSIKRNDKIILVTPVLAVLGVFIAWMISASYNIFTFVFFFSLFFAFFTNSLNLVLFRSHSEIIEAKNWVLKRTAKLSLVIVMFLVASLLGLGTIGLAMPGIFISFIIIREKRLKSLGFFLMAVFAALAIVGI